MSGRPQAPYTRHGQSSQSNMNNVTGGASSSNNLGVMYSAQSSSTPRITSPYSSSSSPGHHSPSARQSNAPLKKYTLQPPPRQPLLCKSMKSLGYAGMFPQRPNQDEDILTETNVRNGLIDRPLFSNEHTCAHDIVYGKLQDDQRLLSELGSFMVDVLRRKKMAARITGPSAFKAPIRTTLADTKKEQWMQELAAGRVSLRQLSRSVPHGFKGEKLLETLAARQVPLLRAAWYIKIVGLSETSQRNTSNASSTPSQAHQWTTVVIQHLKRQLNELTHSGPTSSSAASTGSPAGSTTGNRGYMPSMATTPSATHDARPWETPEGRTRFEQRWSYSTRLTRWQYYEGLLDQRVFLRLTSDALTGCGSFEAMWLWLTGIIQDYLDEYKRNRTLVKLLIETLIKAYNALKQCENQLHGQEGSDRVHTGLRNDIEHLIQSLFLSTPDMFVLPRLSYQYGHLLEIILGDACQTALEKRGAPEMSQAMQRTWKRVKSRNQVFCGPPRAVSANLTHLPEENATITEEGEDVDGVTVVRVLDSISHQVDSGLIDIRPDGWVDKQGRTVVTFARNIFGTDSSTSTVTLIVGTICRWATNPNRNGYWRPYLMAVILTAWRDEKNTAERRKWLQDALTHYLDECAKEHQNQADTTVMDVEGMDGPAQETTLATVHLEALLVLFDTLIRLELFSYQRYLLRLIARGDLEPSQRSDGRVQQCLEYIRSFPIHFPAPAYLANQRRVALYGTHGDHGSLAEAAALERLKAMTRQAMGGSITVQGDALFSAESLDRSQPVPFDRSDAFKPGISTGVLDQDLIDTLRSVSRYTLYEFTHHWLMEEVKCYIVKQVPIGEDNWRVMTLPGSCLLNSQQYLVLVHILEYAQDYLNVVELALWVLEKTNERSLYSLVIDTLRQYSGCWKLLKNSSRVAKTVWDKHISLTSKGIRERSIMLFMVQLAREGYELPDTMRQQLKQDLQPKYKASHRTQLAITDEMARVVQQPTPAIAQSVAETLCGRCQTTTIWIESILTTSADLLRQTAKLKTTTDIQLTAYALVDVLREVVDHGVLTGRIDDLVLGWLGRYHGPHQTTTNDDWTLPHTWLPLWITLLVARDLVGLDTILTRFVLPWLDTIATETAQLGEANLTEGDHRLATICKHLLVLVRLLVLYDGTSSSIATTGTDDTEADLPWQLTKEDVFRLQVRRPAELGSSLTIVEPMFGLMEKLVLVSAHLPLSSPLLQEIIVQRANLLKISWFRQACLRDLNGVYRRFTSTSDNPLEAKVRKAMLSIVDELIGGTLTNERHTSTVTMVPQEPDFIEKLQRVFSSVNQWNEEQCRVQICLLLDTLLLNDQTDSADSPSHNEHLEAFVRFFFGIVLSAEETPEQRHRLVFFRKLLHGLREPVLATLLHHGLKLVDGNGEGAFPSSVLLMPCKTTADGTVVDCAQYRRRCVAFLSMLQHMMSQHVWTREEKMAFLKQMLEQIKRFKGPTTVYRVMQGAHVSFADATRALQLAQQHVDAAITLLATEGLATQPLSSTDMAEEDGMETMVVMMDDIRTSLVTRLRLIVPFASLIWEHPNEEECHIFEWIRVLVPLLGNPIVHGNGSEPEVFEFTLDLVSMLVDEIPKDLRKMGLAQLSAMYGELVSVPAVFQSRVKRILPFLAHNVYLTPPFASALLGVAGTHDPQQQQQHVEVCLNQSKPWEWLEDYLCETPHDNDAPINLAIFQACKTKRTEGTYVRWFKCGYDDGLPTDSGGLPIRVSSLQPHGASLPTTVANHSSTTAIATMTSVAMDEDPPETSKRRRSDIEEGEIP